MGLPKSGYEFRSAWENRDIAGRNRLSIRVGKISGLKNREPSRQSLDWRSGACGIRRGIFKRTIWLGNGSLRMKRLLEHPIAVLGLPLDSLTAEQAIDAIEGLILSGGTHQVATANLDFWLNSLADQHLHRIIAGCSLVLADGMPLVWVSKLMGCPLAERVTGVDLVPRLAKLSAEKGYRIFLLG